MFGLVTDQADKYFYGSDWGGNNVLQYTIGATGGLTAMNPAALEPSGLTLMVPRSIPMDPFSMS